MSGNELIRWDPMLRSEAEELVNSLTHGIGWLLSVIGAGIIIAYALASGDLWRFAGCTIYAFSLVSVYACSTLSHALSDPKLKRWFRKLDQGCIYLLIVGTYTPFSLAHLRTGGWWAFLGLLWSVALFGFFSKVLFGRRVEAISIWLYVLLGWLPIVAVSSLVDVVAASGLWWMLIGGLGYTAGIVFLLLDNRWYHLHAVWHVFVIAGSMCHFFAILFFVAAA